jgi:hypothetical protein
VLFGLSRTSPAYIPGILTTSDKASLLLPAIAAGLLGGFGEELGWTGFATPRLRLHHGVFATGLYVGALWGVWHYLVTPAWIAGTYAGELPLALFLTANGVLSVVGQLTAYRVLMVWVSDRTGSLLLAGLMHASLIASTLFLLAPEGMAGTVYVTWSVALAAALWMAVAAVVVAHGGHLSPEPLQGESTHGGRSGSRHAGVTEPDHATGRLAEQGLFKVTGSVVTGTSGRGGEVWRTLARHRPARGHAAPSGPPAARRSGFETALLGRPVGRAP